MIPILRSSLVIYPRSFSLHLYLQPLSIIFSLPHSSTYFFICFNKSLAKILFYFVRLRNAIPAAQHLAPWFTMTVVLSSNPGTSGLVKVFSRFSYFHQDSPLSHFNVIHFWFSPTFLSISFPTCNTSLIITATFYPLSLIIFIWISRGDL